MPGSSAPLTAHSSSPSCDGRGFSYQADPPGRPRDGCEGPAVGNHAVRRCPLDRHPLLGLGDNEEKSNSGNPGKGAAVVPTAQMTYPDSAGGDCVDDESGGSSSSKKRIGVTSRTSANASGSCKRLLLRSDRWVQRAKRAEPRRVLLARPEISHSNGLPFGHSSSRPCSSHAPQPVDAGNVACPGFRASHASA